MVTVTSAVVMPMAARWDDSSSRRHNASGNDDNSDSLRHENMIAHYNPSGYIIMPATVTFMCDVGARSVAMPLAAKRAFTRIHIYFVTVGAGSAVCAFIDTLYAGHLPHDTSRKVVVSWNEATRVGLHSFQETRYVTARREDLSPEDPFLPPELSVEVW